MSSKNNFFLPFKESKSADQTSHNTKQPLTAYQIILFHFHLYRPNDHMIDDLMSTYVTKKSLNNMNNKSLVKRIMMMVKIIKKTIHLTN